MDEHENDIGLHCKPELNPCQSRIFPEERIRRLRSWLALQDSSYADLARRLGVSRNYISLLVRGRKAAPQRIQQMVELGVPAELLPQPREKKEEKSEEA